MEKYADYIHRQGATDYSIRHMDKILGKVSPSPYSRKITVVYGELCVCFAVQILSLQVDLVLSDVASTSD